MFGLHESPLHCSNLRKKICSTYKEIKNYQYFTSQILDACRLLFLQKLNPSFVVITLCLNLYNINSVIQHQYNTNSVEIKRFVHLGTFANRSKKFLNLNILRLLDNFIALFWLVRCHWVKAVLLVRGQTSSKNGCLAAVVLCFHQVVAAFHYHSCIETLLGVFVCVWLRLVISYNFWPK